MAMRHEWKHRINRCDMLVLRQRLKAVMEPDRHGEGGCYTVRSLYFDSPDDRALREKLDGVNIREKFRIRCYDGSFEPLNLEKKTKYGQLCRKETCPITQQELQAITQGELHRVMPEGRALLQEFLTRSTLQGLRPKTLVEYRREAYIYAPGNVRVTLDHSLRTAPGISAFAQGLPLPLSPDGGIILEIKWDEFLPDIIRSAVGLENRQSSPCSKYALCRIYG